MLLLRRSADEREDVVGDGQRILWEALGEQVAQLGVEGSHLRSLAEVYAYRDASNASPSMRQVSVAGEGEIHYPQEPARGGRVARRRRR